MIWSNWDGWEIGAMSLLLAAILTLTAIIVILPDVINRKNQ